MSGNMKQSTDNKPGGYEIPVKIKKPGGSDQKSKPGEIDRLEQVNQAPPVGEAVPRNKEGEEMGRESHEQKEEVICKDEQIARLEEQIKRLSAEFENFRRRQEKRFEDTAKYAGESVVSEFLPVLDSIRMAHGTAQREHDFDQLLKGLEMIASQLRDTLGKLGVEEIKAVGETFDPALHHAVQAEMTHEYPDQHIIEEYQTGYKYMDRVLRPSMVRVARNP